MTFTNENPCDYYYTSADPDFSIDISRWLEEIRPQVRKENELLYNQQHNPDSWVYNLPIKMSLEELDKERLLYRFYFPTEFTEDESPVILSIEEIQRRFLENCGLSSPKIFECFKKVFPDGGCRYGISYITGLTGYKANKHFHPHILSKNNTFIRPCKTCLIIVPVNHKMPVTERVFFNHQEPDDLAEEQIKEVCRFSSSLYDKTTGKVVDILMPSMGEYLVVEFSGSLALHWLENYGTENEYICFAVEN